MKRRRRTMDEIIEARINGTKRKKTAVTTNSNNSNRNNNNKHNKFAKSKPTASKDNSNKKRSSKVLSRNTGHRTELLDSSEVINLLHAPIEQKQEKEDIPFLFKRKNAPSKEQIATEKREVKELLQKAAKEERAKKEELQQQLAARQAAKLQLLASKKITSNDNQNNNNKYKTSTAQHVKSSRVNNISNKKRDSNNSSSRSSAPSMRKTDRTGGKALKSTTFNGNKPSVSSRQSSMHKTSSNNKLRAQTNQLTKKKSDSTTKQRKSKSSAVLESDSIKHKKLKSASFTRPTKHMYSNASSNSNKYQSKKKMIQNRKSKYTTKYPSSESDSYESDSYESECYDSEDDGFIDDEDDDGFIDHSNSYAMDADARQFFNKIRQKRNKYMRNDYDDDDKSMEASAYEAYREEERSNRLGRKEDQIELQNELRRKKEKAKRLAKQKR